MRTLILAPALLLALVAFTGGASAGITVKGIPNSEQAAFAAAEIQGAARERVVQGDWEVTFKLLPTEDAGDIRSEGFRLDRTDEGSGGTVEIAAVDLAGLLYGGLEVAEIIRTAGIEGMEDTTQNAHMQMRGTKFNIPLDVRTPSYTDVCDAAQQNIAEMWSFDFWKEYIDTLARYRYNFVSLWNLHPFPSLVKVPEYPDVALDDVQRSTVEWEENYSVQGPALCAPEILNDVEVVKRMTIDEKIDFWRKVMRYGKSRNVDFYFVTWNIFIYGTERQVRHHGRLPKQDDH